MTSDIIAGPKGEDAQFGWFEAPEDPRDLSAWIWRPIGSARWIMSIVPIDMDSDADYARTVVLLPDYVGRAKAVCVGDER